jgi:GNAT superfamily N-acetyltransferase
MSLTYFKRFRMEIDLNRFCAVVPRLDDGYRLVGWDAALLSAHAEAKYMSFRAEIDANVFPCLGEYDGCARLMREISRRDGFVPEATWLIVHESRDESQLTWCGTVQGVRDSCGMGAIQNLGVVPEHRGHGLGTHLLLAALSGFRCTGLTRAFLEVTAQNEGAIRLYRRIGFHKARTVYKAVEVAYARAGH